MKKIIDIFPAQYEPEVHRLIELVEEEQMKLVEKVSAKNTKGVRINGIDLTPLHTSIQNAPRVSTQLQEE